MTKFFTITKKNLSDSWYCGLMFISLTNEKLKSQAELYMQTYMYGVKQKREAERFANLNCKNPSTMTLLYAHLEFFAIRHLVGFELSGETTIIDGCAGDIDYNRRLYNSAIKQEVSK